MFVVWLGVVSFLAWTHLVWRDEVKPLSLALQSGTVYAMIKELHWEGHPAVWYLILRAAHALIPRPEVLLLVSIIVAAVAVLILVLRAPFSLPFLALLLFSRPLMYEYSVMARNYGISMLLLFLFCALYARHRTGSALLGVLLFLLANCNVHSVLLVGGLLLFWSVDIFSSEVTNRPRKIRIFLYNAALASLGVVTCFITVFPNLSDSIMIDRNSITFQTLIKATFLPSRLFIACFPGTDWLARVIPAFGKPLTIIESLILFGSTLGLIRHRGAFLAALTTLVGFSLFFVIVYRGIYRHQALWLVFMVCMYWLAIPGSTQKEYDPRAHLKSFFGRMPAIGTILFVLVILLQLPSSARRIFGIVSAPVAALDNGNNNIGSIFARYPDLNQAVVIADPDFLLETLPYYVSNPTYLMREQRYGNIVHFTRKAQLELSLDDVLTNARRLRQETGRPVVILLSPEIDPSQPARVYREGYNWTFTITPEQVRAFQLSTHLLAHHSAPNGNGNDEGYDVFVMEE
jgi:hypothetical protein